MRLLKTINYKTLLMLLLTSILASCVKMNNNRATSLHGTWAESSINASATRQVEFSDNGKFSMYFRTSTMSTIRMSGTYLITGNRLQVNVTQQLVKTTGKPDEVTALHYTLYDNCTFSVKGDILTLNYTTYPADAPVSTTAIFTRVVAKQ